MMAAAKEQTDDMHLAIESRAAEALEATAAVMKESKGMIEITRETHARLERLELQQQAQQQQQQLQQQLQLSPSPSPQWITPTWPYSTPVPRFSEEQQVFANYALVAGAGFAVAWLFKSSGI